MRLRLSQLRSWTVPIVAVLAVLLAIAVLGRNRGTGNQAGSGGIWTCSMHPQIRMDHFDRCPLCGMDLVPVAQVASGEHAAHGADHLQLSEHAAQMARVGTASVELRRLFRDIRTVGKIDFDETRMRQIASRVNGRVEQVFADFPGTMVKKGDHLVSIYSPDLVSTQEEFLLAARRDQEQKGVLANSNSLAASARRRLLLWGISEEQINTILRNGKAETLLTVYSTIGGTVVEKMVRSGQYVKEGETLYTIADLTHVWLLVEIYETDLPWIRFGQTVEVSLEGDSTASFTGLVGFVEPILNEQTRTVRVRVILKNEEQKLKPGMFAQALVRVAIMPDGTPAPTGLEGKFACPMHPYVVSETADKCRVCEMALERIAGTPIELKEPPTVLSIPADAVLTTGRRQLVYVEHEKGIYQLVEPHLGPRAGDYYPVLHGLKAGDQVVNRGNFLLDSQFQISGKPSLLYPEGLAGGGASHAHGTGAPTATASTSKTTSDAKIEKNLSQLSAADRALAVKQKNCPITGEPLGSMGVPVKIDLAGDAVFLCCPGCTAAARGDPAGTVKKLTSPPSSTDHDGHRQ